MGKRPGSAELEIRIDPKNGKQVAAWAQAAVYLDGRIHAHPDEKPGRTPDMSPPAAAAMRAVLKEVAFAGVHATLARSAPHWAALHQLAVMDMSGSFKKEKDCAAISHSHAAREEAALRLISNRMLVLKDVVNPTLTDATHFVPLTQLELKRCPIEHVIAADQFMREVSRRLLSYKPCTDQFEEMPAGPLEAPAWTMAAAYLDDRIQATPEEKPGRPPDLSIPAAAAMRAVLREVGGLNEPSNNRVKENSEPLWQTARQPALVQIRRHGGRDREGDGRLSDDRRQEGGPLEKPLAQSVPVVCLPETVARVILGRRGRGGVVGECVADDDAMMR